LEILKGKMDFKDIRVDKIPPVAPKICVVEKKVNLKTQIKPLP